MSEDSATWFNAVYEDDERVVIVGVPASNNPDGADGLAIQLRNKKDGIKKRFGISKEGAKQLSRLLALAVEAKPGDVPFVKEMVVHKKPQQWEGTYVVEPKGEPL